MLSPFCEIDGGDDKKTCFGNSSHEDKTSHCTSMLVISAINQNILSF